LIVTNLFVETLLASLPVWIEYLNVTYVSSIDAVDAGIDVCAASTGED
jgi:hypothetical protein